MPSDRILPVGGPGDLAGAIPHLLGYYPDDVLVCAPLYEHDSGATRIGSIGVGSFDAVDDAHGVAVALHVAESLIAATITSREPGAVTTGWVVLLMVDPQHPDDAYRAAATSALRDTLTHMTGAPASAYRAHDGRWRGLDCTSPDCCPPEGLPVSTDGALVATYAMDGVSPLPNRAAWRNQFVPTEDIPARARVRLAAQQHSEQLAKLVADDPGQGLLVVDEAIRHARDPQLSDTDAGRLIARLGLPEVVRGIARAALAGDPADRRELMAGLLSVGQRAPWRTRARVFALYAATAYAAGNSGLALLGCEAALATEQPEPLVTLLHTAITGNLPPTIVLPAIAQHVGV